MENPSTEATSATTGADDESIVTRLKRRSNAKQLDFKHLLKKCSSSDCDCHHQQHHTETTTTTNNNNTPTTPSSSSTSSTQRTLRNRASNAKEEPSTIPLTTTTSTTTAKSKPSAITTTNTNGKKIRCQVQGRNVVVDESDYNKYIRHGKWQSGEFFRYELQSN